MFPVQRSKWVITIKKKTKHLGWKERLPSKIKYENVDEKGLGTTNTSLKYVCNDNFACHHHTSHRHNLTNHKHKAVYGISENNSGTVVLEVDIDDST